jgi:hypothetical protein
LYITVNYCVLLSFVLHSQAAALGKTKFWREQNFGGNKILAVTKFWREQKIL